MPAALFCTMAGCTFMTERFMNEHFHESSGPRVVSVPPPRSETPLVPRNSIAGRALIAVVAIMTFLASLTSGGVILVTQAASEWQADVAQEMTIQVIPAAGRDAETDVARAVSVARNFPGIEAV